MDNFTNSMAENLPKLNANTPIVNQGNDKLPLELVEHLFKFLSHEELMVCYNVCANWRRLIFDFLKKKSKRPLVMHK